MCPDYEKMCAASRSLQDAGRFDLSKAFHSDYVGRRYLVKESTGWKQAIIVDVVTRRVKFIAENSFFNVTRETWNRKNTLWLPTQDELQGMIDRTAQVTLHKLELNHPELSEIMVAWRKKFLVGKTDWRELWLRVYMWLSHAKTWDGECWK